MTANCCLARLCRDAEIKCIIWVNSCAKNLDTIKNLDPIKERNLKSVFENVLINCEGVNDQVGGVIQICGQGCDGKEGSDDTCVDLDKIVMKPKENCLLQGTQFFSPDSPLRP